MDKLIIYFGVQEDKQAKIVFFEPIQFFFKIGDFISEICEILEETSFLENALYNKKEQEKYLYKLFQITDKKGSAIPAEA